MLVIDAGREAASVVYGRYWPERLLYSSAVPSGLGLCQSAVIHV